jgi:GWxTD domain-containing protein
LAQPEPSPLHEQIPSIYIETINLLSGDAGRSRLDVTFRIPYDFFIFVKDTAASSEFPFVANAEITLEILDSNKLSVARELTAKEIGVFDPPTNILPNQFLEGVFSFNLKPGKYAIVFEVRDVQSDRKYFSNNKTVTLKEFSNDSLRISDIIFLDAQSLRTSTDLIPLNLGGDVPFGKNFNSYFEVASHGSNNPLHVSYSISKILPENRERNIILRDTLPSSAITNAKSLTVNKQDRKFTYHVTDDAPQKGKYSIWMAVRADTMTQGSYEMEITAREGNNVEVVNRPFHIRWIDMPLSLRSLQTAVDALEYIATEDEMKQLRTANLRLQHEVFDAFWKKRDKTPETAFNEVMAEYYKRVDYAFIAFRTVREQNGIKTERAKAYILYGPPTTIDRELSPAAAPKEIWTYKNLNKRLIFIDESRIGDYKLVMTEQL